MPKPNRPLKRFNKPKTKSSVKKTRDSGFIVRKPLVESTWPMRLTKYISHCGICSRREAIELVKSGDVTVNKEVITEPGTPVNESDVVTYKGKVIKPETQKIYLLLNKPKDYITTLDDERGRKTVMELIDKSITERIYPVGRLDRNTTGLLLLTNDGELANKLSHPSGNVLKVYKVTLNQEVKNEHLEQIRKGLILEDGKAEVDAVNYMIGEPANVVSLAIHSGKNRIVRRIFEHLKFEVVYLDRTHYAGLTKKDIPRGRYRPLTDREIIMLRHFKN
jgi:23S rRNA pseudouridine2605 synthase